VARHSFERRHLQYAVSLEHLPELDTASQILPCLVFTRNFFKGTCEDLIFHGRRYHNNPVGVTKNKIARLNPNASANDRYVNLRRFASAL
jgi:hypothetical protein